MNKAQTNNLIREQVANVLFNTKGVTAVHPAAASSASKRKTGLPKGKWTQGVKIEWVKPTHVDITVSIDVSPTTTISISYNLIKNLVGSAFKKIPKVNLNEIYINVKDIKETNNGK